MERDERAEEVGRERAAKRVGESREVGVVVRWRWVGLEGRLIRRSMRVGSGEPRWITEVNPSRRYWRSREVRGGMGGSGSSPIEVKKA